MDIKINRLDKKLLHAPWGKRCGILWIEHANYGGVEAQNQVQERALAGVSWTKCRNLSVN